MSSTTIKVIKKDDIEHDIEGDIWGVNIGDDIEHDTGGDINLWTNRELESRVFLPEKCQNHTNCFFFMANAGP